MYSKPKKRRINFIIKVNSTNYSNDVCDLWAKKHTQCAQVRSVNEAWRKPKKEDSCHQYCVARYNKIGVCFFFRSLYKKQNQLTSRNNTHLAGISKQHILCSKVLIFECLCVLRPQIFVYLFGVFNEDSSCLLLNYGRNHDRPQSK